MEVAVLGAGSRGRALAGLAADAGHTVTLHDTDANVVMDTVDDIERERGPETADRVSGTTDLESAVDGADVVLEVTDRDVAGKRDLLAMVEEELEREALLVTSHPETPVTAVAAGLRRPERAVGLHVVSPNPGDLLEIVVADQTGPAALEEARSFVETLDATPTVVGDAPGFATRRLDLAHIAEAARLVEEGVAGVADVDRSMTVGRDHQTGPLELADIIGLDTVTAGLEDLADRLDGRFAPPGILRERVAEGATGRDAGEGFYVWEGGEAVEPALPAPSLEENDGR